MGGLTLYWDVKDPEVTTVHVGAEKRSSGGPLCANTLVPFIVLHQWNHGTENKNMRSWHKLGLPNDKEQRGLEPPCRAMHLVYRPMWPTHRCYVALIHRHRRRLDQPDQRHRPSKIQRKRPGHIPRLVPHVCFSCWKTASK